MMQNPFEVYEVAKMQRHDQERKSNQYWALGLDKLNKPRRFWLANLAWGLGIFALAWVAVFN